VAIEAGRIVTVADFQRLVGTEVERTSPSAGFTAETVVDSVTVSLVAGTSYRIVWLGQVSTSSATTTTVANERIRGRIREDNISGTQRQLRDMVTIFGGGVSYDFQLYAKFTAVSTGSKTFVATCQRVTGTGTITSFAAGDSPVFFRVEIV